MTEEQMTVAEINERGTAFFHLAKLPQALNCFKDALQQAPDNAIAWANQAVTLAELGLFDRALESFDRALSLDAGNPVVLNSWRSGRSAIASRSESTASSRPSPTNARSCTCRTLMSFGNRSSPSSTTSISSS